MELLLDSEQLASIFPLAPAPLPDLSLMIFCELVILVGV